MAWFPILLELGGQPCLVAGGGKAALRKTRSLLEAGASVTVVAMDFDSGFDPLPIRRRTGPVSPSDTRGMALVVDATGDAAAARSLRAACRQAGIPFNCAARPEPGDAAFPAVLRRGKLVAGISTSGASPAAAAWVRDRLAKTIPEQFEEILLQMESLRSQAGESFPDQRDRARFLHACLDRALQNGSPLSREEIDEIERKER